MVSGTFPAGGDSFTRVGNVAPPRPTMPLSPTALTISAGVRASASSAVSGAGSVSCASVSGVMIIASCHCPWGVWTWSSFLTVPVTGECTGAPTNPPASAIICPRCTVSPALTSGLEGAPMACESGSASSAGICIAMTAASDVSLLPSGCMPPFLKVFIVNCFERG